MRFATDRAGASVERFDLQAASLPVLNDPRLQDAFGPSTWRKMDGRAKQIAQLPDYEALRNLAASIKQHTLENLGHYIRQVADAVGRAGGQVHVAADANEARRIVTRIARDAGVRLCVKSKSMASEEVELTPALEAAGIETVETDLGEFIAQLCHEKPSHIVAPIMHMRRQDVGRAFSKHFGLDYTDDPPTLTMHARAILREKFRRADMGITGGNFLVAQTGQACICTNEGNGRLTTTMPRVLVSLVGIEKTVPRLCDLAVLLKLLARSSGMPITVYTSLFGATPGRQFHLVLLDNGRSKMLQSEYRDILRCIRCGACLNACPVFRRIGGHSYGSIYSGPVGSVLTPLMRGLGRFADLPQASSLCGACFEACPVKIDIPEMLIRLRRESVGGGITGFWERLAFRTWARCLKSPLLYRMATWWQRRKLRKCAVDGWVSGGPRMLSGWTLVRDLPAPAPRSFHQLWKRKERP